MKHLNTLPDLVLRLIFSKLPLVDLLTAARVCPLWKSYQTEISTKIRSLTLLVGPTDAESLITNSCFTHKYRHLLLNDDGKRMHLPQHLPQHFHLKYNSFSLVCAVELVNNFSHVTSLEIAIKVNVPGQFVLDPIVTLLTSWSPMLKSLKMFLQFKEFKFEYDYERYNYKRDHTEYANLFKVINSMSLLEHLTLDLTDKSISSFIDESITMDLSSLNQLRQFNLQSNVHFELMDRSLGHFVVLNDNLTRIGFGIVNGSYFLEEILLTYPQLTSKIVHIPSSIPVVHSTRLSDILPHFSSLSYLHFGEFGYKRRLFDGALNYLSLLPQLTHLHITTKMFFFKGSTQKVSRDQLTQLGSIQVLTLSVPVPSNASFESNHWAHLFPNVQVIELLIELHHKIDNPNKTEHLYISKFELQRTLSPFAQCPKLRHLYTCEKLFSVKEFYYPSEYEDYLDNPAQKFTEWTMMQLLNRNIIQVEK